MTIKILLLPNHVKDNIYNCSPQRWHKYLVHKYKYEYKYFKSFRVQVQVHRPTISDANDIKQDS